MEERSGMTKEQIRRLKIQERDSLLPELRSEWSQAMAMSLAQSFEYQMCEYLHVYINTGSEPDTYPLLKQAWADSKKVVVPISQPESSDLQHSFYEENDELSTGHYGISVPKYARLITKEELFASKVLVIVPLVAFNQHLYRAGYGKGYYDRFLQARNCFAFGYAFSLAFCQDLVAEAHDVQMDAIVTEQGIIRARRSPVTTYQL